MNGTEKSAVLIVDDHPENLVALEALLNDMELDLVKAQSGNEALRLTLHHDFALVLLDVQMPEMDGFETAELMRQNPKTRQLPIIFVTAGMKSEHHQFKGYQAGAVDYLMKPIEPSLLRTKVRVFCELFSQRRQLETIRAELELQNRKLQKANLQLERETAQRLQAMEELRQKDALMIHQNRMAAMGEMLNNIAHQWRQPLNILGLRMQEIGVCFELGVASREIVEENVAKGMEILRHLSQTIDDFRNFTTNASERCIFPVEQAVVRAVSLVRDSFTESGVTIDVSIEGDPAIDGSATEFTQVILNLLMNARDAYLERDIREALIAVRSWQQEGRTVVTVADKAGGIGDDILDKVFDAYFTTKETGKGTGIGLFMSKNIVEKYLRGRLTVRNVADGAEFRIEV